VGFVAENMTMEQIWLWAVHFSLATYHATTVTYPITYHLGCG